MKKIENMQECFLESERINNTEDSLHPKLIPNNKNLYLKNKLEKLDLMKSNNSLYSFNTFNTKTLNKNNINSFIKTDIVNNTETSNSSSIEISNKWDIFVKEAKKQEYLNKYNSNINNSNLYRNTSKQNSLKHNININNNNINQINNNICDNSFLSNNLVQINNLIEENDFCFNFDNFFLTKEFHSIIPFLMIDNPEIHRLTLSDFEIKYIINEFISKSKIKRLNSHDYYKLGLIYFYSFKYFSALEFFHTAYMNTKDSESKYLKLLYSKWFSFSAIIVFFAFLNSENNCIYKNYNGCYKIKIKESIIYYTLNSKLDNSKAKDNSDSFGFFNFCCSSSRKEKTSPVISKISSDKDKELYSTMMIYQEIFNNDLILNTNTTPYYEELGNNNERSRDSILNDLLKTLNISNFDGMSLSELSKKIVFHLKEVSLYEINKQNISIEYKDSMEYQVNTKKKDNKNQFNHDSTSFNSDFNENKQDDHKKNIVEIWYLNSLIAIFNSLNSGSNSKNNYFQCKDLSALNDIAQCLKKIKELDNYYAYLIYCDVNFIKAEVDGKTVYNTNNTDISNTNTQVFDETGILKSLSCKYNKRIEAYLKLWSIYTNKHHCFCDNNKALLLSESFYKIVSSYEEHNYYIYILITNSLSFSYLKNYINASTLVIKDFSNKMYYPTLFLFYAKMIVQSNEVNFYKDAEIALESVFNLLYEDLQNEVYYLLGVLHKSSNNNYKAHCFWSKIDSNNIFYIDKQSIFTIKKFISTYSNISNYLNETINKINHFKETDFTHSLISSKLSFNNSIKTSDMNNTRKEDNVKISNNAIKLNNKKTIKLLKSLERIKNYEISLFSSCLNSLNYYIKQAYVYMYFEKNLNKAFEIIVSIIDKDITFFEAHNALFKLVKYLSYSNKDTCTFQEKEYSNLLLKISVFTYNIFNASTIHLKNNDKGKIIGDSEINSHLNQSSYVQIYINLAKALCANSKVKEGINILINLLDVFSIYYVEEEMKYLSKKYLYNKQFTSNICVDYEDVVNHFSKYTVFNSVGNIINSTHTKRKPSLSNMNSFNMNNKVVFDNEVNRKVRSMSLKAKEYKEVVDIDEINHSSSSNLFNIDELKLKRNSYIDINETNRKYDYNGNDKGK